MKRSVQFLLALAALCMSVCAGMAGASRAHADRIELGMGPTSRFTHADSVLAVHDSSSTGVSLGGAYRWASMAGVDLLADASLDTDTAWATTFGRMRTSSTTRVALAGVRASRPLARALSAHARLALGAARVALDVSDVDGRSYLQDHGHAACAYLGAGIDFVPLRPRTAGGQELLSLGVRVELGYLAMTSVGLAADSPDPDMPDGAIEIPAMAAALGDLDMSALTLRVALIAHF
jgi:hypothetical protein